MRGYICKFSLVVVCAFLLLSCHGAKTSGDALKESPQGAKSWVRIGPGGGGGVFYPTINPADPKHIFVCCDMTGAYVTYDGGQSWRMFNLQTGIRDFEFAVGEPKTVYASTNGSLHSEDRGKLNSGLYRSDDKGVRWRLVYPSGEQVKTEGWLNGTVNRRLVDPGNSNRVFIGINPLGAFISRGAERRSRAKAKVMVSRDRGESFKELAQLEGRSVVAILPGDWWGKPGELIVFTEQSGFYVSKESGRTIKLSLSAGRISAADGGRGRWGKLEAGYAGISGPG